MDNFSTLSHKSLYSSTPVLTGGDFRSSHSFSTPPLSNSPRLSCRGTARSSASPLLRSNIVNLQASPLKSSPPLSDRVTPLLHELPIKVNQTFHNSFYALRLAVLIKGKPVELSVSENPKLSCEHLTCSISFCLIFNKLQQLLKEFGISNTVRCFSDPFPLIELAIETVQQIKNLLLHRDEITSYIWVMVCNEFINTSIDIDIGLFKGESRDSNATRLQLTHRPGNSCYIDIYLISPNCHQREVDIYPITLANVEHANKLMMSSMVFDFPAAMSSFLVSFKNPLSESVSLSDLRDELKDVINWFHMGIYLDIKPSILMNILFNCRKIGACRSQFLSSWHNQQASALGDNLLTWTEVIPVVVDIGQKTIADNIVRKYGLDMNKYHELIKQREKTKEVKQTGLLSISHVAALIIEMKEVDRQMADKAKPLRTYELQRKILELSVNEVFKSLNKSIDAIREKSVERINLKESISRIHEEMEGLEAAMKLFNAEKPYTRGGLEISKMPGELSAKQDAVEAHLSYISRISEEKTSKCKLYGNKVATLNREIKALVKEITEQRSSLVLEHQLLLSKCQQMHQLQGVTGLLLTKRNVCGMKIDQFLQQKLAATSMFKSSVFQLHIDTLTQELKEKESQLTLYKAREKRAQKMTSETQEKLEDMDLNEETGEMTLQGAEGENDEDKRLEEWLKPVIESVELRNKLLKAKLSHWNNERSRRITSAEGKALAEMLNAMKELNLDSQEKTDFQEDIDSDQTPTIECCLKPNQSYQAVKANTLIRFTIELESNVKLNLKKNNYRIEVKSIANNSITSMDFTSDLTSFPNTLKFDFRPTIRGRHHVSLWSNNKPLKGAAMYRFQAKQNLTLLGYPVRVIDDFNYPYNIYPVQNSQVLLISECKGHKVVFIDKVSGNKILNIGGKGLMKIPNGIAVTEDGVICVVDSGSHCVCLFTQQGVPIGKFGTKGDAFNEFFFPYGIKISPFDKSICVCDHNNDRIQIFAKDMSFQRAIHASTPYDIAYDSKKCMHVTDRKHHLIAVFNEKDQCIHSISGKGSEEGKLLEPRGIAIDEQDFIYVVEETNCRVSIFDNLGQFVTCFGSEGSQPGEFSAPQGICIDNDGYIYVCDMLNNRIQVF